MSLGCVSDGNAATCRLTDPQIPALTVSAVVSKAE